MRPIEAGDGEREKLLEEQHTIMRLSLGRRVVIEKARAGCREAREAARMAVRMMTGDNLLAMAAVLSSNGTGN